MPDECVDPLANVSRETSERLTQYAGLLERWNRRINLVSSATLHDVWTRHFADSAQLIQHAPDGARLWADLGSGAGFPGLVIGILAAEILPALNVICVESDARKASFLRAVSRETGVSLSVRVGRAEAIEPLAADVVSARALAPLPRLLALAGRHMACGGTTLLMKGARYSEELSEAQNHWRFECETATSCTDPSAVILKIGAIHRV
jgi:16S rRNA (guanine527-N7)-methyltransferase